MRRIAFVGAGSIGRRHIRNLHKLLTDRSEQFTIDLIRSGKGGDLPEDVAACIDHVLYEGRDEVGNYDILFVTNPTSLHHETIRRYAPHTEHMFIEKPVFDSTECRLDDLGLKEDSIYYVACPLRYTSVLQYVKTHVSADQVIAVRAISSSYLPDWRPGTDYRNTYSAHKELGGGVSIDLIHEWDYLTWLFGMPKEVKAVIGRYSDLEIDSDDAALYVASNDLMTYELHLDYYGRKTMRQLQIFLPDETIEADLTGSKVTLRKDGEEDHVLDLTEDRNAYQSRELDHFLNIIDGRCANDNDLPHALEILKLTRGEI